jgi:acetylornithine deacetylase/succinyl-diaminopimelate desuccinylase-like protein
MSSFSLDLVRRLAETFAPTNHEEPRRQLLAEFFAHHKVACTTDAAGNLLVLIGRGPWDETLVLDAHFDVVGAGGGPTTLDGNRLTGQGVADNLGSVALLAMKAAELARHPERLSRPICFLFSVGEEGLGNLRGVQQFVADHPNAPELFISFDLSYLHCSKAGLGSCRYSLGVEGPGGHSWTNRNSPSAIDGLIEVLGTVRRLANESAADNEADWSFNTGVIHGGEGINSIARRAEASVELRAVSPIVLTKFDAALRTLNLPPPLKVSCRLLGERPAAEPTLPAAVEEKIFGCYRRHSIIVTTEINSTNINLPLAHDWPAVQLGLCQGGNIHRPDEWLDISSLEKGWLILSDLVATLSEPVAETV